MTTVESRWVKSRNLWIVKADGVEKARNKVEELAILAAIKLADEIRAEGNAVTIALYQPAGKLAGNVALSTLIPTPVPTPIPVPPPEPVPVPVPVPVPPPVVTPPAPLPGTTPPATGSIVPANLQPMSGPLVRRTSTEAVLAAYDARFVQFEATHWAAYVAAADKVDHSIHANHYGALRSRLEWSIRNGLPVGPSAPDSSIYGHGRAILRSYLTWVSAPGVNYNIPPHNSTGIPDSEILATLESDTVRARGHIHRFAASAAYQFGLVPDSYVKIGSTRTEVRWIYEALQAFAAAHRLNIPYGAGPGDGAIDPAVTSWLAAGTRQITHVAQNIRADGALPMPAEPCDGGGSGCENLLFNSSLATELYKWDSYVQRNATAVTTARKIMAHVLAVWEARGRRTLPYQSMAAGASGTEAPDVAAYHVWPAFVTAQETGDARYAQLAEHHFAATKDSWWDGVKQWNQGVSTGAQATEAFRAGIRRP